MYSNQNTHRKNVEKWSSIEISILVVVVIGFGLSFFSPVTSDSHIVTTHSVNSVEVAEAAPQLEWVPELPVRLVIPAINVDAEVGYVGLEEDGSGNMDAPSNFTDVAWYQDGVRPGMRGSAVIAGHYNGKDVPEAVFYNLRELQVGDEVVIMSAERIEDIFRVVKIETYAHDDPATEVFISTDGKKRLNLITCAGDWLAEANSFNERTVVFTELLTDVE